MFAWNKLAVESRAALVARVLKKYFPKPEIPLVHKDGFTLFVAVVLSAQCTDKRVNMVTPVLFAVADTPKKLAVLGEKKLLSYIRTCGLAPTKAKNLIAAAKILVDKYKGLLPNDREALQSLPGVGRKTASVVLSQAFNVPAFPVDTHIWRSGVRWGLSRGKNPEQVERDLCAIYPEKDWNALHLRMIHYARGYCTARGCEGPGGKKACPLCTELGKFLG